MFRGVVTGVLTGEVLRVWVEHFGRFLEIVKVLLLLSSRVLGRVREWKRVLRRWFTCVGCITLVTYIHAADIA